MKNQAIIYKELFKCQLGLLHLQRFLVIILSVLNKLNEKFSMKQKACKSKKYLPNFKLSYVLKQ